MDVESQTAKAATLTFTNSPDTPVMDVPDDLLATLNTKHPRIQATSSDFKRLRTDIKTDPTLKTWYKAIKAQADGLLKQPVVGYKIDGGGLGLENRGRVLSTISTLGFVYQITKDSKYAERAYKELEDVSKWPDWNTQHYLDTDPKLADYILRNAIKNMPNALMGFGPDGAWHEGPGYWGLSTQMSVAAISALKTSLGTDFGLSKIDGFSKTGYFPAATTGPFLQIFNYADSGGAAIGGSQLFWLAKEFNQPGVEQYWKNNIKNPTAFDLIWYDAKLANTPETTAPLGVYYRGTELVSMRSSWTDNNAWYIGLKGGDNLVSHGHFDLGSFVFDAYGKRFVSDVGADNYSAPGYMSALRYTFYRTRAEGHNTLVINPNSDDDQVSDATAKVIKFNTTGKTTYAVMDLTKAYAPSTTSTLRGMALVNGNILVINDEIKVKDKSELYWFMHTSAKIKVAADGKTAQMTIDGKSVVAEIVYPAIAKFTVMDAVPLKTSPKAANSPNTGIKKLTIHLTNTGNTNIVVVVRPTDKKASDAGTFLKPLSDWK